MIPIQKSKSPASLVQYKLENLGTYDDFPSKDEIRQSLVAEQKGICAYCMSRITTDKMKIEHWNPQSNNAGDDLDYQNMLGCCKGGDGQVGVEQTCDTAKGDKLFSVNPSKQQDWVKLQSIFYGYDGTIYSSDAQLQLELDTVLNLNTERLKHNRKDMLVAAKRQLSKNAGQRTKTQIQKMIDSFKKTDSNGFYTPYFDVAVKYLEKEKTHRA
jgi:uncharacterized protein (TIGR02646 family)